ncbi:MAG TPA: tetratricopeptide repeat protein [Capsulimonadaceae bacterium]|jgi:tetratricopeptide (TPR) repeat protein
MRVKIAIATVLAVILAASAIGPADAWDKHLESPNMNSNFVAHVKEYEAEVAANPNDVESHVLLGNAYTGLRRAMDAFNQYKIAIQLDPTYARTYYNLGLLYYLQDDYPNAIQSYKTAVKLWPDYQRAWYNLGCVYREMGNYDAEIAAMRKTWIIGKDYMAPMVEIGDAYEALGDLPNTVKAFGEHLKYHPEDIETRRNISMRLLDLHNSQEALAVLNYGLKISKTNYERTFLQAAILECHEQNVRAAQLYLACHNMKPGEWAPYANYTTELYVSGDHEQAKAIWRKMAAGNDMSRARWARKQLANNP